MAPETKTALRSTAVIFLLVSFALVWWLVLTLRIQAAEYNMMNSTTLATETVNSNAKNDATNSADPREAKWFNQALEHFNANSSINTTWPQRYWMNTQYFNGSGPVFLLIGGEAEEDGYAIFSDTLATQLAKEIGALLLVLEHRFYGQSRPTPDASALNLRFLSMDQAVADLVNFRNFIHSNFNLSDENKWVAIGCSYPGELAALLRLRHPERIYAALASSASVKYGMEIPDYYRIVNSVINASYPDCALVLGQAMATVNFLMESEEGRANLSTIFQNRFGDLNQMQHSLTGWIVDPWSIAVQYDSNHTPLLKFSCDPMLSSSLGEPIQILANSTLAYLNNKTLRNNSRLDESDWDKVASSSYMRIWSHQYCFEFGSFQTLRRTDWPLSADRPLSLALAGCQELFNETFSQQELKSVIEKRNQELGGDQYKGTRVVFVNGDRDPWSAAGLTDASSLSSYNTVVVIEGASHCSDFYGHQEKNLPQTNQAIAQIKQQIKDYLLQ